MNGGIGQIITVLEDARRRAEKARLLSMEAIKETEMARAAVTAAIGNGSPQMLQKISVNFATSRQRIEEGIILNNSASSLVLQYSQLIRG